MKLKLIAASTAIALASPSLMAMELYKDDKKSLELGGYFGANYVVADETDEVSNGSSRINFNFTHQMQDGWTAFAKAEWAVSLVSNNSDIVLGGDSTLAEGEASDTLSNRLGFVGAQHEKWGSVTVGKQWGSIYNVIGVTDNLHVFGGDAAGAYALGDGGYTGTGRAEQAIQYNNNFGNLSVSVQMQGTEETVNIADFNPDFDATLDLIYDNSYGMSLTYALPMNLSVGVGYNEASVEFTGFDSAITEEVNDTLTAVSVTYGAYGEQGLYAAVVAVEGEYHEFDNNGNMIEESTGVEAMVSYRFANDLELIGAYNAVSSEDAGNDYEKSYMVAGVAYYFSDTFRVYSEYKLDDSTNADGSEVEDDDVIAVGARFSF